MARILYIAVHDEKYPRNARIRKLLQGWGHEVHIVRREEKPSYLATCIGLLARSLRPAGRYEIVVLSELGLQYAWVAKAVALRHRAQLIVDGFVGMHETNVGDWQRVSPNSVRARLYKAFDSFANKSADIILIDTDLRAKKLRHEGAKKVITCPVGAPNWATYQNPGSQVSDLRILYYGNYIPLHGLDYVLRNLALMPVKNFDATFIGEGEGRPAIEELAAELGLSSRIKFVASVPERELLQPIRDADVVLGIFGDSPKASSVIANKVWQGLACGRPVLTRSSEALEEIQEIAGTQLIQVETSDPMGLARELTALQAGILPLIRTDIDVHLERYVDSRFAQLGRSLA